MNGLTGQVSSQYGGKTNDAPRELGFIQRMDGLANGLGELQERLEAFTGRLSGSPLKGDANAAPAPIGLGSSIQCAEARLRECVALVVKLHEAF